MLKEKQRRSGSKQRKLKKRRKRLKRPGKRHRRRRQRKRLELRDKLTVVLVKERASVQNERDYWETWMKQ